MNYGIFQCEAVILEPQYTCFESMQKMHVKNKYVCVCAYKKAKIYGEQLIHWLSLGIYFFQCVPVRGDCLQSLTGIER